MEPSQNSNNDAANYPRNVAGRSLAPYALDAIRHQLDKQAPRLFTGEAEAALDILNLANGAQGMFELISSRCSGLINSSDFWPSRINSAGRLREHLGTTPSRNQSSHLCKFL